MRKPIIDDFNLAFKISPRLIDLFGKELVARTEAALAELVKNAYDSDAKRVVLRFAGVAKPGGQLVIEDDGDGMSLDDLRNKWMLIGTKDKVENPRTRRKRRKVGEKGIGRLGAHKLSNRTVLRTKRKGDSHWVVLDIDWTKYYSDSHSFEGVVHPYTRVPGKQSEHGTKLELLDLRDGFTQETFERLQAELTLLVPPLPGIRDFSIEIVAPEFPDFRGDIQPAVLKAATYSVDASFDGKGRLTGQLRIRGQSKPVEIDQNLSGISCGPLNLKYYVYILKKESFEGSPIQLSRVQSVLDVFKGVRVYRDNFKVGTYGDLGNDWLGIDEQHIKKHEVVIHSKQIMGAVHITRDGNPELIDTTNREGLVANRAFFDLINVCSAAVDEINAQRWAERRERERKAKKESKSPIDQALNRIERAAESDLLIPPVVRREIHDSILKVKAEQESQIRKFEDELQMYRNLASLGISTAAFAHETEAIGFSLELHLKKLKDAISGLPSDSRSILAPIVAHIDDAGGRSIQLVELLLEYVRQKKQRISTIQVDSVIADVLKRYKPFLDHMHIDASVQTSGTLPSLHCVPMDIEAVLVNLITNAAWAARNVESPRLLIEAREVDKAIEISVSDSGKGITRANLEKIFLPFFTTKGPKGIGLGLTIVRDTVRKYQGDVIAKSPGKLGGATFVVSLPYSKQKRAAK